MLPSSASSNALLDTVIYEDDENHDSGNLLQNNLMHRSSTIFNATSAPFETRENIPKVEQNEDFSKFGKFKILLKNGWENASPWIIVVCVAVLTSFTAYHVEISVELLSDIKLGVCKNMFLYSQRYCCGLNFAEGRTLEGCGDIRSPSDPSWYTWGGLLGLREASHEYYALNYAMYVLVGTMFATAAACMVDTYSSRAAGSGIPEVKTVLSGFVMKGLLGVSTLFTKCFGLCMAVASSLSLGKEGPFVHIACCWENITSKIFVRYKKHERKQIALLSAATAAGVTVAFGAPIGGVLFSLEEVSSYFPPKTLLLTFFSAVCTATLFGYLDPRSAGTLSLFEIDSSAFIQSWELSELIPFAIMGVFGGIFGAAFIHLTYRWLIHKQRTNWFKIHPVLDVIIVALISTLINYPFPFLRTSTPDVLSNLFLICGERNNEDPFSMCLSTGDPARALTNYAVTSELLLSMCFAMLVKFIQTIFTFECAIPAGLFIPCLAIGAFYGRLIGLLTISLDERHQFMNCDKCLNPGVYALIGAASMLGGVTRMTISLVVIMLELTGGLAYVVPFMMVVLVAKFVGEALCDRGVYDAHIMAKGYPYLAEADNYSLYSITAADVMQRELIVFTALHETLGSILWKLQNYEFGGFPLVQSKEYPLLHGYILKRDVTERLIALNEIYELTIDIPVLFTNAEGVEVGEQGVSELNIDRIRAYVGGQSTDGWNTTHTNELKVVTCNNKIIYIDASALVATHHAQLITETPIKQVHYFFKTMGSRICLFTRHGVLEGLLTRKDLVTLLEKSTIVM